MTARTATARAMGLGPRRGEGRPADSRRAWAPALSYVFGSVPFSQLAARAVAGADLREVGSGTVSGTGLYEVAGFGPLAAAGVLEVAKGAVGPALCGRTRPLLGAVSAAAAITGHDWSPWLRGAGGRGLSPALGAMLVLAPEGAVVLAAGMAVGRLVRQSGLTTILAASALVPLLWRRRGAPGAALACSVLLPMGVKRVLGNAPVTGPAAWKRRTHRLVFDRDPSW